MSIATFYTSVITQPGQQAASGQTALGGDLPAEGLNFFDLLLANYAETLKNKKGDNNNGALQSDNPLLEKDPKIDLVRMLAENPEIREQIEKFSLSGETDLAQTLALNQRVFDEILKPLLGAEDAEKLGLDTSLTVSADTKNQGVGGILQSLMIENEDEEAPAAENRFAALLKKIQNLIEKSSPALIATGLTPEQIAELQSRLDDKIASIEQAAEDATNDKHEKRALYAEALLNLIQLVAPQTGAHAAAVQAPAQMQTPGPTGGEQTAASQQPAQSALAAALNTMVGGRNDEKTPDRNTSAIDPENSDAENFARRFADSQNAPPAQPQDKKSSDNMANIKADATVLQNAAPKEAAVLFVSSLDTGIDHRNSGLPAGTHTVTGLSNATSLVTNAPGAGQPHPAAQMVAASIRRNAADGQPKIFTIQMEPPELGRVEVRMNFGKEKTIKVELVIEKSETFAMLQRDSHLLERTLQAIGLETDGGMSFELAQDNNAFSQNGGHDSHGNNGSGDPAPDDESIQSTMTWFVDPQTGYTRYNIMA
jgi:hypothetical protein